MSLKEVPAKYEVTAARIIEYRYDPGDKRSYGELSFTAVTKHGELRLISYIDSSGALTDGDSGDRPDVSLDGVGLVSGDRPQAVLLKSLEDSFHHYYSGDDGYTDPNDLDDAISNAARYIHRAVDTWERLYTKRP